MNKLLNRFPKKRPELPSGIAAIYDEYMRANRQGTTGATSLAVRLESWMHQKVAQDIKDTDYQGQTLEIGAGTLIQLDYEPPGAAYDVVEPFEKLYIDSKHKPKVRKIYQDIAEIPDYEKYDRIVSVAVLEHICDLPQVLAKAGLLLKKEGRLRVAIPSEGSMLWGLAWRCTTGIEFYMKYKENFTHLRRFEHVNDWWEIKGLLKMLFSKVKSSYNGVGPRLSFYHYYECQDPNLELCQEWLRGKK